MVEHPVLKEPTDTREAIMLATYRALQEHGYADLTIQRIGDHFEKSKSLLYHHYDSKDELLLDFLEFMLDEFEGLVPEDAEATPAEHLDLLLDVILIKELSDERREFGKAMVELRAQATHDDRYREHFTRHDEFFKDRLRDIVTEGIETGDFRDVDPDRVATFLLAVLGAGMTQRATTNLNAAEDIRAELDAYVETTLLTEGRDE